MPKERFLLNAMPKFVKNQRGTQRFKCWRGFPACSSRLVGKRGTLQTHILCGWILNCSVFDSAIVKLPFFWLAIEIILVLIFFNSQIKFVILLAVNHTILDVSSENLALDQLIIPKLLFFFILITYLIDILLILLGEVLSWSLMGIKGLIKKCSPKR